MRGIEAGRNAEESVYAAQQESRANEQHERERHLRNDESTSDATMSAARAARALSDAVVELASREVQRRQHADGQTDQRRHRDTDGNHGQIEPDGASTR